MSNQIPLSEEWKSLILKDLITGHQAGIYKKSDLYGEGTNIVGVSDLYQVNSIDGKIFRRVPLTVSEKAQYLLKEGDLIYGESSLVREGIGRTLCVVQEGEGTAFAWHTRKFSVNRQEVKPLFLYYLLSGDEARKYVTSVATQTALTGITTKDFFGITLNLPSLQEQKKIAEILMTIDRLIEKTEALIAKYQAIKQGMMHDLFTRGVDENGHLRPPYGQAPELYKESAIGWLPEAWEVSALEVFLKDIDTPMRSGPFGSALLKSELVESGIPFLGIDNVYREYFSKDFSRFVSLKKFNELKRYAVRKKDVMITIMGTVGRCCVVPEDVGTALSSKHVWTMTFDEELYFPELICWQLNYAPWVLKQFDSSSQGAVMDAISSSTLKSLKLPRPGINEQKQFLKQYLSLSDNLQKHKNELLKLGVLKTGLMQDLLTGKVRVNVDDEVLACA